MCGKKGELYYEKKSSYGGNGSTACSFTDGMWWIGRI